MHAVTQALRQLRAHPWFSSLIVVLLALGIGANTTMFSLVHAVLLKPLPYPEPGELVLVRKQPTATAGAQPGRGEMVADREYLAWAAAGIPSFQGFAGYTTANVSWRRTEGAERVAQASVTPSFLPLLGVRAHRGRLPGEEDARAGAAPVAVISYDFWQSRFGGKEDVLGAQVVLDGDPVTLVGVLPPAFLFSEPAQVWRPLVIHEAAASGGMHQIRITLIRVLARMKPGADLRAAQAQLDLVSQRMWEGMAGAGGGGAGMRLGAQASGNRAEGGERRARPEAAPHQGGERQPSEETALRPVGERQARPEAAPHHGGERPAGQEAAPHHGGQRQVRPDVVPQPGGPGAGMAGRMMAGLGAGPALLVPLQEHLSGAVRPVLWLLFGAVGLVLLIACVNVANLQLARATVRRHELAVRTALGASRRQLALGLLVESLVPALLGGGLGIMLSYWGLDLARSLLAAQLPRVAPLEIDLPVMAFTLALAAVTGTAFGLAPAWSVRRLAPQEALHSGGRTGTGTPGRARGRQACVALEIALALALVANAGLLLKSFVKLRSVDLGFRTDALSVTLPTDDSLRPAQTGMMDPAAQARIAARQRDLAGRYAQALAAVPGVKRVAIADRAPLSEFAMMFMTNIEGYSPRSDGPEPPLSALAVEPAYFELLGISLREGRLLAESDGDGAPAVVVVNEAFARRFFPGQTVVGRRLASPALRGDWATVVGVVGDTRRNGQDNDPPAQVYFPFAQWPQSRLTALLAFDGDEKVVAPAVLKALRELRPELPFDAPVTLQERLDRMLAPRKLVMGLLVAFAGAAVALAALGIFGVMAYTVAQRTHEFGVRMALGADRGRVLKHVLAGAGVAIGIGVAGGVVLGLATSRLLASMLFAVSRTDGAVLAAAAGGLAVVGLAASLVPAVRASRVNPVEALRAD